MTSKTFISLFDVGKFIKANKVSVSGPLPSPFDKLHEMIIISGAKYDSSDELREKFCCMNEPQPNLPSEQLLH